VVRFWFWVSFFVCVGFVGGEGGSFIVVILVAWVLGFVLFVSCEFVCERCVACAWPVDAGLVV